MKKQVTRYVRLIVGSLFFFGVSTSFAQDCNCDYTVSPGTLSIDNNVLNLPAGSIICITGGATPRNRLLIQNFKTEDASRRFVFKNCGGPVIIKTLAETGIDIKNCKNYRLTGTGSSDEYGIQVIGQLDVNDMDRENEHQPNWGVGNGFSSDFEIDHVRVSKIDFAAFGAKTDVNCDNPATWRENFTMRNVSIHHNRVDTTIRGEGFYIGYTFFDGPAACPERKGHEILGLKIFKNKVYHTGADGIQVTGATSGCEIYENDIQNYGVNPFNGSAQQANGIQLSSGTKGLCYNNFIKAAEGKPTAHSITVFGTNNVIFNNILVNPYDMGIYINDKSVQVADKLPGAGYKLYNNTIINPTGNGIRLTVTHGVKNVWIKNNIIIKPAGGKAGTTYIMVDKGSPVDSSNNFRSASSASAKFVNPGAHNYRLTSTSPAINKGINLYAEGVTFDFERKLRPSSGSFEQGAFEHGEVSNWGLYVNAGGDAHIAGNGPSWERDKTYNPHPYLVNPGGSTGTGGPNSFTRTNTTTAPNEVLGSYRIGKADSTIKYTIPVPVTNAVYKVELFFAGKDGDTFTSGARRFRIVTEGQTNTTYDVFDRAGTGASMFSYTTTVNDGFLDLSFIPVGSGKAQVNGIRVTGLVQGSTQAREAFVNSSENLRIEGKTILIYPNKVSDQLHVQGIGTHVEASIFNQIGESVFTVTFTNHPGTIDIDVRSLQPGLYHLVLQTNGKPHYHKFIKD